MILLRDRRAIRIGSVQDQLIEANKVSKVKDLPEQVVEVKEEKKKKVKQPK
jgi:hypothetical protein